MILFILGESGSGKTTLEHTLVNQYWFKMFDKYSTRPARWGDDKSGYHHITVSDMLARWATGELDECIKYNGEFYGMAIPWWNMPDEKYVAVVTESWFQQFIDMGIYRTHEVYSIFLTNSRCEEFMLKRWDSEESIAQRLFLNSIMKDHMGSHLIVSADGWTEPLIELLKLQYPKLF